jgi:hypothetical protein
MSEWTRKPHPLVLFTSGFLKFYFREHYPKVELSESIPPYPILPVIYASVNSCFGTVNM